MKTTTLTIMSNGGELSRRILGEISSLDRLNSVCITVGDNKTAQAAKTLSETLKMILLPTIL